MNKTKIIITYGPSIEDKKILNEVLKYTDIVRINLSHGSKESWLKYVKNVRDISNKLGKEISLLADIPGPKIRVSQLKSPIHVEKGDIVTFSSKINIDNDSIPVDYKNLHIDAKPGITISLGDGYLKLKVTKITGKKLICTALNSGDIQSRKGINLHNAKISAKVPTTEDVKLAQFAVENKFDFIAMSFVRSAKDVETLRKCIPRAFIIAKVERKEAVDEIKSIAKSADAIMVARGDLAFDVEIEKIPTVQHVIINASRNTNKPVIVATQMLASMVNNNMPTRAEVNDIAGAVVSGSDCLMLSDETAMGKYPVEAVKILYNTIKNAESYVAQSRSNDVSATGSGEESISFAAVEMANNFKVECIFAPTQTGATARRLSILRPKSWIIAMAHTIELTRKLSIYYGVESLLIKKYSSIDSMSKLIHVEAKKRGMKNYVVVFGTPNKPGSTDTLRYIEI